MAHLNIDRSLRTQLIFVGVRMRTARNKSQKFLTTGLCTRKLMSFTLCYYVIGLFNRVQTNHKHKRKGVWLGCEEPFLSGERCVASQKMATEETRKDTTFMKKKRV